ncbi:MAG: hypothetical protein J5911_01710 [Clostridia bacterium]|nr:hypothetical protein [Clostridia bacterium]
MMITADIVVLIAVAFCIIGGAALGFSRWLKILTGGVFGVIISIVVCYFIFGIALDWAFVKALMLKITEALQENGSWICNFLLAVRLDLIVFAALLFLVVHILRKITVYIIASVMQADNKVVSIVNRILGVVLLFLFAVMLMLVVFQIVAWVMGVDGGLYPALQNSVFGLDKIYANNPLMSVIEGIKLPWQNGGESFAGKVLV